MLRSAAALALLSTAVLQAQQFEVATVRPSAPNVWFAPPRGGPGTSDPEHITYEGTAFKELLLYAYDVQPDQIKGPDWIEVDAGQVRKTYDISAKIPAGATREQVAIMLQHLLEDRFQLKFHRETVQHPGLSLVVAKSGSKLKPSAGAAGETEEAQTAANGNIKIQAQKDGFPNLYPGRNQGGIYESGAARMRFRDFPLSDLVQQFSIMLGARVVDRTNLNSKYDFTLQFDVPQNATMVGIIATLPLVHDQKAPVPKEGPNQGQQDAVPILSQALEQQLGLKLDSTKVDVDTMVIDRIQQTPTEN